MSKVICIEGNVAAGKTTMINKLKEHFKNDDRIIFISEPVDRWVKTGMLRDIHSDDKKVQQENCCEVQTSIITDIFDQIMTEQKKAENTKTEIIVAERSIKSNICFIKKHYDSGNLTDLEYETCVRLHRYYASKLKEDIFIYLRPSLETCMKRCLISRERTDEKKLDVSYFKTIDQNHEDIFGNSTENEKNGNIYTFENEKGDGTYKKILEIITGELSRKKNQS